MAPAVAIAETPSGANPAGESRPVRRLPVIARRGRMQPESAEALTFLSAAPVDVDRPRTRADCANGPRPCPYVSCRHHLFLDVTPAGSIRLNFPGLDVDQIGETCSLDVAEAGPLSLPAIAAHLRVTFQRAKQLEARAYSRIARQSGVFELINETAAGGISDRRVPVARATATANPATSPACAIEGEGSNEGARADVGTLSASPLPPRLTDTATGPSLHRPAVPL